MWNDKAFFRSSLHTSKKLVLGMNFDRKLAHFNRTRIIQISYFLYIFNPNYCLFEAHQRPSIYWIILNMFQAEPALVYDSVQVFAHGLASLDRSHVLRPVNLSCDKEEPWDDGLSLYNYINAVCRYFNEFHCTCLSGNNGINAAWFYTCVLYRINLQMKHDGSYNGPLTRNWVWIENRIVWKFWSLI